MIYKIELRKTEGVCELFPVCTFIVTNKDDEPKEIVFCSQIKRNRLALNSMQSNLKCCISHMQKHKFIATMELEAFLRDLKEL